MEDIFHEEFLLEKDENISDTEYDLKQLLLEAKVIRDFGKKSFFCYKMVQIEDI